VAKGGRFILAGHGGIAQSGGSEGITGFHFGGLAEMGLRRLEMARAVMRQQITKTVEDLLIRHRPEGRIIADRHLLGGEAREAQRRLFRIVLDRLIEISEGEMKGLGEAAGIRLTAAEQGDIAVDRPGAARFQSMKEKVGYDPGLGVKNGILVGIAIERSVGIQLHEIGEGDAGSSAQGAGVLLEGLADIDILAIGTEGAEIFRQSFLQPEGRPRPGGGEDGMGVFMIDGAGHLFPGADGDILGILALEKIAAACRWPLGWEALIRGQTALVLEDIDEGRHRRGDGCAAALASEHGMILREAEADFAGLFGRGRAVKSEEVARPADPFLFGFRQGDFGGKGSSRRGQDAKRDAEEQNRR